MNNQNLKKGLSAAKLNLPGFLADGPFYVSMRTEG
jgi:hypothetical protein